MQYVSGSEIEFPVFSTAAEAALLRNYNWITGRRECGYDFVTDNDAC